MNSHSNQKAIGILRLFFSVFPALITIAYVYRLKFPPAWEILIFAVVSLVVSLIWNIKGHKVCYLSKSNVKKRLLSSIPVLAFSLGMSLVILPCETYFSNAEEMLIAFKNYFLCGLSSFAFTIVILLAVLIIFCSDRIFDCSLITIFTLSLTGYLQEMALNGSLMSMDGTKQEWETTTVIINAIIWLVIVLLPLIAYLLLKRHRETLKSIAIYGSMFILAVRLITLVILGINTPVDNHTYVTSEDSLTVYPSNNCIVFVLDWYDSQIFDNIVAADSEYAEPFNDFTYYDNATCRYGYTEMAIPYLLTGLDWIYDMDSSEYQEYAFANGTLLQDIKDSNYKIDVYTGAPYIDKKLMAYASNCTENPHQDYDFTSVKNTMIKISKYCTMPYYAKNDYFYTTNETDDLAINEDIWTCEDDSIYYSKLFNEGLSLDNDTGYDGAYKFIHLYGAHGLYNMTENGESFPEDSGVDLMYGQSRGVLKLVSEYIRQLKELGLYDDATIIITADHGQNLAVDGANMELCTNMGLQYPCSPIMLVKPKEQKGDALTHNSVAASHTELIETVRKSVTGVANGKTLSDLTNEDNASRTMIVRRHNDIPYRGYIINGNVHDWNNWILAPEP